MIVNLLDFNVNGLRSFLSYIDYKKKFDEIKSFFSDFDIVCFQETKLTSPSSVVASSSGTNGSNPNSAKQVSSAELFRDIFPCKLFADSRSRPGYSGTAIFSKLVPIAVYEGFTGCLWSEESKRDLRIPCLVDLQAIEGKDYDDDGDDVNLSPLRKIKSTLKTLDSEGRCIIADFGVFVLINAYFPNEDRDKKGFKMDFNYAMEAFCKVCTCHKFWTIIQWCLYIISLVDGKTVWEKGYVSGRRQFGSVSLGSR